MAASQPCARQMEPTQIEPTGNLLIVGLPKAGNVFISLALQRSLGCIPVALCTRLAIAQQIMPERLAEFTSLPLSVGGGHLPPTRLNLRLLEAAGVKRAAVLFRDPRDALISWWHHLMRPDIANASWVRLALSASELIGADYFDLRPDEALRDLARSSYPRFQDWMAAWLEVADRADGPLRVHVSRYEAFVEDKTAALRSIMEFFGHSRPVDLPAVNPSPEGIDLRTHFRRGRVGSFRDEAPEDVVATLNAGLDRRLAERLGWPPA